MTQLTDHRSGWPWWMWPAYAVLFSLAVPWYWPQESNATIIVWGWPRWALISLFGGMAISGFTVFLALRHWPDADADETDPSPAVGAVPRDLPFADRPDRGSGER